MQKYIEYMIITLLNTPMALCYSLVLEVEEFIDAIIDTLCFMRNAGGRC